MRIFSGITILYNIIYKFILFYWMQWRHRNISHEIWQSFNFKVFLKLYPFEQVLTRRIDSDVAYWIHTIRNLSSLEWPGPTYCLKCLTVSQQGPQKETCFYTFYLIALLSHKVCPGYVFKNSIYIWKPRKILMVLLSWDEIGKWGQGFRSMYGCILVKKGKWKVNATDEFDSKYFRPDAGTLYFYNQWAFKKIIEKARFNLASNKQGWYVAPRQSRLEQMFQGIVMDAS